MGSTYTRVNTVVFFKGSPFYGSPLILDRLSGRCMDWGSECFVNHPSKGINRESLISFLIYVILFAPKGNLESLCILYYCNTV